MPVTLERRSGWMTLLLAIVGVAGVSIAAMAWLRFPQRSPEPESAGPRPTVGAPGDGRIRVPLFVDPSRVRPTPRFRFSFDPPEALAPLRASEKLDGVLADAADDLTRVTRLMRWSRAQWEPGIPSPYPPIDAMAILADIRRGFTGGFCAQYNYVLVQALQSFGIPARYVSVVDHEVAEAFLPDRHRWICIDPLNDTLYRDDRGEPLSVLEIHRRVLAGQPVTLDQGHRVKEPASHLQLFRTFAVWLKNDHITSPINFTDLERYKVYFLDSGDATSPPAGGGLWTSEPADLYP